MTVEKIESAFRKNRENGRTSLVAYVTVGFRSIEESYECALAALRAGADVLELGVPFSDPSADGPVIARASYEAIGHGGSLRAALGLAQRLRKERDEPIVLFTYYNPVVAFGDAKLPAALKEAGVDGMLVVDLPPDEGHELRAAAAEAGIAIIPLLAPTSGAERERDIWAGASGFLYYVSVTGVTGSGVARLGEAGRHAAEIQRKSGLPVAVGFGIDSVEKARQAVEGGAQAVVVGTAIIKAIGAAPEGAGADAVSAVVAELRQGLDASPRR